jgi:hypothetical protein
VFEGVLKLELPVGTVSTLVLDVGNVILTLLSIERSDPRDGF